MIRTAVKIAVAAVVVPCLISGVAQYLVGCMHMSSACDKVAETETAAGRALEELEERGFVDDCAQGNASACMVVENALIAYEALYKAYGVCYEDTL